MNKETPVRVIQHLRNVKCGEALKLMKNGKSPGSDGFTVDFFKFFGKILVLLYFVH